jgi:hypothetical protein
MGMPGNVTPPRWVCGGNVVYKKYKKYRYKVFVFKEHIILQENKIT